MRLFVKQFLRVVLGTLISAAALNLFLVPANIAPGGISGLAIVINYLTALPVGVLILCLNVPIFLWGIRHFSRKYMLFSVLGMFLLSSFTDLLAFLKPISDDTVLCAVFGGGLLGLGIGIVFSSGFTTGGTDIVAQVLKKKVPYISLGKFVLIIDTFVVALAGIVFAKWEVALYSAIALFISTYIIDLIIEGGDFAKVAYIISDKQEILAKEIFSQLNRGTTLLHGSSFYTQAERSVLLCVVKPHQIPRLKALLKDLDPKAFVIVTDAREVLGEGFKKH